MCGIVVFENVPSQEEAQINVTFERAFSLLLMGHEKSLKHQENLYIAPKQTYKWNGHYFFHDNFKAFSV